MNEKGEVLIQKRASNRKENSNKWGICAGHITAGESVEFAVVRELEEELGMKVELDDLEFLFIDKKEKKFVNGRKNYAFNYVYIIKTDWKIKDYKIQKEELSEIKYITVKELKRIVRTQNPDFTFSKSDKGMKLVEELEKRMENHKKSLIHKKQVIN